MNGEQEERTVYHCQMGNCNRPVSGDLTRTMYRASEGEEYPDDVRDLPVCWRHYVIDTVMEVGMAAAMFGLLVGGVAWWTDAGTAAYIYYGLAILGGLVLSYGITVLRRGQVIPRD